MSRELLESNILKGVIVKVIGAIHLVKLDSQDIVEACPRTTAKKTRIVVGDRVKLIANDYDKGKYIIVEVLDRNSYIPRPPLANIEKLLIIIANKPAPDLELVDKLVIYCAINNIEPVIIVNKMDISEKAFLDDIKSQYFFLQVFGISAKECMGIDEIRQYISSSFCAVGGQSAVGKSSFINALIPNLNLSTQGLSQKIDRGKHTTRVNEVYIDRDIMIADTPGFSSLDLTIEYNELENFYPEFDDIRDKCRYLDCSHVTEGADCAVISAMSQGLINKDRYNRFTNLYRKLKANWESRYD